MTTSEKSYIIENDKIYATITNEELNGIIHTIVREIIFEKDHDYRRFVSGAIWYGLIRPGETIDQMHDDAYNNPKIEKFYNAYMNVYNKTLEHYLKIVRAKNIIVRIIRGIIFGFDLSNLYFEIPQNTTFES